MPNIKSAKKRMRQNEKCRMRNKGHRSLVKTSMKKYLEYIQNKDAEQAKEALPKTISALDKAWQKGILHKNYVNRKKSMLHSKLNELTGE